MLIKRGISSQCCNMSTWTKSDVAAPYSREKVDARDADLREDREVAWCKAWDREIMMGES